MEMDGQQALWVPPVAAWTVQAHFEWPYGWQARMQHRHEGGDWSEAPTWDWGGLDPFELVDAVARRLGLVLLA